MTNRLIPVVAALVTGLFAANAVQAETYILEAGKWKGAQTNAVEAAGGEIVWKHGPTGLAMVQSDNPGFLDAVDASGAFKFAEADLVVSWGQPPAVQQSVAPEDDTHFQKQWNLEAIDAPAAWAAGCTGAGVRVAVIDGGINHEHNDLAGQVDTACSASFVPGEPFNSDTGVFWHGSHVAGIVAAKDNDFGIVGVAPDATIMAVKALHDGSGSFGAVIGAILFSADPAPFGTGCAEKADIINMSLGAVFPKRVAGGFHSLLAKAVNFAGSKGVLVLSSAGNEGIDFGQSNQQTGFGDLISVPAQAGSGLAVSATGPIGWQANGNADFDRLASYSNYGEGLINIAAPGGDFAYPGNELCTFDGTTFPCWVFDMVPAPCGGGNGFFTCWAAGTSMASPAAAGVAALIKGANPDISLGRLKTKLQQSAVDKGKKGHDEVYGHGWVNALNACTQ